MTNSEARAAKPITSPNCAGYSRKWNLTIKTCSCTWPKKSEEARSVPPTDFPQECALKTTSFFEVPPEIERARGNCMRFIRAVERFFEGLRDGMAAQRAIEGRPNDRSVFTPMTELFSCIPLITLL